MTQFFVKNRENLTDRIVAFTLMPKAPFTTEPWSAGAHIDIDLGPLGSRSYSLITWPNENSANYQIAVQREDQGLGGSQAVHAFKTGQSVIVSPPKNSFALIEDDLPVALIAGGIGITPIISMATALHKEGRLFILHYLGRSAETIACSDRLCTEFGDAVDVHLDDRNPIDLSSTIEALSGHRLYICGPKGMIDAVRNTAVSHGIPSKRIHIELFETPTLENSEKCFEVEIKSTGDIFEIPENKSILEVLEAGGVDLIYDCQRGDCGICCVDVLHGIPDHRDVVLSQAEKDSGKVMQICVSRAHSDRLVLDI